MRPCLEVDDEYASWLAGWLIAVYGCLVVWQMADGPQPVIWPWLRHPATVLS